MDNLLNNFDFDVFFAVYQNLVCLSKYVCYHVLA